MLHVFTFYLICITQTDEYDRQTPQGTISSLDWAVIRGDKGRINDLLGLSGSGYRGDWV